MTLIFQDTFRLHLSCKEQDPYDDQEPYKIDVEKCEKKLET